MEPDTVFATLLAQIRDVVPELGAHAFARSDSMADLGVNSIERSEVLLLTLDALGLKVSPIAFHGARNIGELSDLIHAKLAA
ncbi:MAG: acyl carrier protein [Hyphomicrobium sp.]|jgi:polyketide biosynthesis acyl carrier protein|uniref:acyl carrier protein n=1 Tax=Hyphomicrobium sp. TaxID=82 RepID=UPI0025C01CAA|nr:acyl carrier protein [Hyphomicrobium sp.]MBX9864413.1 acyl carrier protein [Hyphomicrobium sp.]